MKLRLASILLIAVALCAIGTQAWAMSANRLWETNLNSTAVKGVAVDSTTGTVYVSLNNQIQKITVTNNVPTVVGTYGPIIYKADGITAGVTLATANKNYIAVDPKTGYLYINVNGVPAVVDMSPATGGATKPVWIRSGTSFGSTRPCQISFAPDGMTMAGVGGATDCVLVMKRLDAGTPGDYTDDTFDGTNYKTTYTPAAGLWFTTGAQDPRGCALDGSGHLYIAELSGRFYPLRRFNVVPGVTGAVTKVTQQEMEFRQNHPSTTVSTCDTDGYGRLWVGDNALIANHHVHCYQDGADVFSFDNWAGHSSTLPSDGALTSGLICCSKNTTGNVKVYIAGTNYPGGTATATYVTCFEITGDTFAPSGTVSGAVHDDTGAPINPPVITLKHTYMDDSSNWSTTGPAAVPDPALVAYYPTSTDGTFSNVAIPPGTWTVVAQPKDSYAYKLATAKTHYQISGGANNNLGDFVLLSQYGDYVTATLGAHNVEQGLSVRNAKAAGNDAASNICNEASSIGGRECRVFGNNDSQQYMLVNVDDNFLHTSNSQVPFWLDLDIYDSGFDRMALNANIETMGAGDAPACAMGWQPKTNTNAWTTWKWHRLDGSFANWFPWAPVGGVGSNVADFRLYALNYDSGAPRGSKSLARITVRRNAIPDTDTIFGASYMEMDTISKAKQFIYGQQYVADPGARYAGGFAVKLMNKTVVASGTVNGKKYVLLEESDRSSGIRMVSTTSLPDVGTNIDVVGSIMADPDTQELYLEAAVINEHWDGTHAFKPIEWANMTGVAGGDVNYVIKASDKTYTNRVQYGVSGGVGVSTVGMLVRLCGKVTAVGDVDSTTKYAYIDDGSHPRGEGVPAGADQVGVKVLINSSLGSPTLQVGDSVKVTGACMLGLYDPTPGVYTTNDHWRYTIVDAASVTKL